ncbi:hypothetical protein NEISICOT_00601 [Neisseria sicca ATCC 29256]|uniref:Uncharacterized protein n=1 Tax=Neisseria sicca ATCC 29256 TaxID=547045 RepID=C6M263_NEISI|nr:hypothetical protein NEISICOT_00601 [Neisseria sicca ATCC 29256]
MKGRLKRLIRLGEIRCMGFSVTGCTHFQTTSFLGLERHSKWHWQNASSPVSTSKTAASSKA